MNLTREHYLYSIHSSVIGYREKDGTLRTSLKETCEICQPGTYGNDPSRALCKKCRGGVICLEGKWRHSR